nr:immunoglobulin light chain junction region [Macaca mulatta]MOW40644.1 immunoglobulin light chain junction region [Macaca mulatta]MOW40686.1 immunoglobulin light chain junction region [Macaca mulatta]MOW40742.1 immunoglobulin light chain junction region [Macaca mulatta]MOW40872.1 immunoglobulin light chain junction region [Macaca mulatta]
CQQYNSDPYGF